MTISWVSIVGKLEHIDGVLRHVPSSSAEPGAQPPLTVARSNLEFEKGSLSMDVQIAEPDAKCQIGLSTPGKAELFAGLNVLGASYGMGLFRNGQWEPVGGAGFGDKPPINKWVNIELRVKGSNIDLYFNGVKVYSHTETIQKGQVSILFQSSQPIKVKNFAAQTSAPVCFVVMQFTEEYNELYKEVIRPTCEKFGFSVVRGDDFYSAGLIIEDITRSIRESALIIADVTPNNPNVFYEVGYAHGIGKPTILLSDRKRDRLPFDISGFRTLFYDNTIGGKSAVEESLSKHLENLGA
jgi:hypothetical protein